MQKTEHDEHTRVAVKIQQLITLICSNIAVATLVCKSTRRFFSRSSGREL